MSKHTTDRYEALTVREYEVNREVKRDWMRIGSAWPNKDGKGFTVQLSALPVNGTVVLRLYEPDAE